MGYPTDDDFADAHGWNRDRPSFTEADRLAQEKQREALTAKLQDVMADNLGGLSFRALRQANIERLPQFKNKHGEPAHSEPDGSDWSDAEWLQAVLGELGEYANVRKKLQRGDFTREEAQSMMADELADVMTYLDILAFRLGIDLGEAVRAKFNRVSDRVDCDVKL